MWLLKRVQLKKEQKAKLVNELILNFNSIPLQEVIDIRPEGEVYVRGTKLSQEQVADFKLSAMALQNSNARRIINDQLRYKAIELGVKKGFDSDSILFAKAWLYAIQEEENLLNRIVDN